jgi:hypothetical protein
MTGQPLLEENPFLGSEYSESSGALRLSEVEDREKIERVIKVYAASCPVARSKSVPGNCVAAASQFLSRGLQAQL